MTPSSDRDWSRRDMLAAMVAGGAVLWRPRAVPPQAPLTRPIPKSGEALPLVGLGSWITFNVGRDPVGRDAAAEVIREFFAAGGQLIDSSPMYGSSQETIGYGLRRLGQPTRLFAADKVWIGSGARGPNQIQTSAAAWGIRRFDLLQVHNLLAWREHLPVLRRMKAEGQLRYIGVTTSEGRRHDELERVLRSEPLDFVQVTYNVLDREVEQRILPLARDRGVAVIINRPFRQGALTRRLAREPLPGWAAELACTSWAQILLKFILAHPAVNCAIPATTVPAHARENLMAARAPLPDDGLRRRIVARVEAL